MDFAGEHSSPLRNLDKEEYCRGDLRSPFYKRKKSRCNTYSFPSLSITNYRRTGYPKRLRLRFERTNIIVEIYQLVKSKVKTFLLKYTKTGIKFYDEPHKIKLSPFNRQKQQYLCHLSIFVEKFFGLFIQKILTQYKCSTNICSRHCGI